MTRRRDSRSPRPEEVIAHYESAYEAKRLETGQGKLDRERSRELLERFLPPAPATILDVGGGPGGHACWLARLGYEVHLIDIVPLHVELAEQASEQQPSSPLASARVGDACALSWADESVDSVLLFGPLYHLTDREDRLRALAEGKRVLKPGGIILAVGISRFASTFDGLRAGFLKDPAFADIADRDLKDGHHRNPTDDLRYFMDTFFHHPDELRGELAEAGFSGCSVYGVEGPSWLAPELDEWWKNDTHRKELLRVARALETESSLLGVSAHLMAVAKRL